MIRIFLRLNVLFRYNQSNLIKAVIIIYYNFYEVMLFLREIILPAEVPPARYPEPDYLPTLPDSHPVRQLFRPVRLPADC